MRKLLLLLFAFVFFAAQAMAQKVVTGKVTDDKGAPLSEVSVIVKGTKTGTVTKSDGTYSLTVPAGATTLVFSYVHQAGLEIAIGTQSVVNATLKSEEKALSEVVVTAMGVKRDRKTLGYGVTELKAAEVTQAHTTNITNALNGKVAGVRVQGSGGSFTGSSIIIRGYTTFTGSNQPLFIVDGIPIDNSGGGSPLQAGPSVSNRAIDLNQEDIESMTVLKGPAAAALYGSRASNGAILITTKKGKLNQKGKIEFNSSYQIESVNRFPEYQNEYAQGNNGVFSTVAQTSWGPKITGQTITNFLGQQEVLAAYPNNVRDFFQQGTNMQNNIAFSQGSDKTSMRFSYGFLRSTGVIKNNVLNRHNFSLNTTSKITNKLTVGVSANYSNNASRRTQQGNQLSNPVFRLYMTPRSYNLQGLPFEDAVGNQLYPLGEDHPYWTIKHNRFKDEINRFIGNASLNLKLNSWLTADYKIGTDVYSTFRHAYDQVGARGGANTGGVVGVGGIQEVRNQFRNLNSNGTITARKNFGKLSFQGVAGTEYTQIYVANATMTGKTIIVRDFEQMSNTTTFTPSPGTGQSKVRLLGAFSNLTFGWKSMMSVDVSLRNDWSSTFKEDKNSYLYYSVAAAFNLTEMFPRMKNNVIENIKLSGNIARVGKAGVDFVYGTDSYFGGAGVADGFGPTISFPFNGIQGFSLSNGAGDANLGPEFTTNKEVTLIFSLFKGRINFEGTRYVAKSKNLIFAVPVSPASGITSTTTNAGAMTTRGWEAQLDVTPIKTKNFTWNIDANYTQFKSMVDRLAVGVPVITLGGFVTPNIRLVAGDEYGQIYGNAYQRDATKGNKIIVGANGLPLITSGVQKIGNPNPKYAIAGTNTLTWKGFSLAVLLEYKFGGDQYSRNIADIERNGTAAATAEFPRYDAAGVVTKPYLFDAVYANGTANTTYVSAQDYWGNNGKYVAAEGFIYNTTWFRVREAAFNYSFPSDVVRRTPFSNITFGVFGRNLFLHAPNYPHLDPEQNALGISNAQGLEFNALPQTRTFGFSLNLTL
jgi:TonB-linked SusC/RagA family outer membrane protein